MYKEERSRCSCNLCTNLRTTDIDQALHMRYLSVHKAVAYTQRQIVKKEAKLQELNEELIAIYIRAHHSLYENE